MKTILFILALLLLVPGPANAQRTGSYTEISLEASDSIAGRISGRVSGHVVFDGRVPAPLQLLITKDMEICGEGYRERKEIDTSDEMGLRNVVVFIEQIDSGKPWSALETEMTIDQKNCFFQPIIQVIPRGQDIEIINSDSTLHNIHAYELIGRARRSLFNISQPEMGPVPQVLNPRRGNQVSLECDSHDFMQGWIFAADNPYAAVVTENGSFEISDIPEGTYTLTAWHPRLGMSSQELTIIGESTAEVEFRFTTE